MDVENIKPKFEVGAVRLKTLGAWRDSPKKV